MSERVNTGGFWEFFYPRGYESKGVWTEKDLEKIHKERFIKRLIWFVIIAIIFITLVLISERL